jgi:hypothetical protein
MTRRRLLQLATSGLLMGAKSSFAQNGASPVAIPRSQYSPVAAEQAQGHATQEPDTWYEFLLKEFNPGKVDYGRIIEERRRALLDATVNNPYFPYFVATTIWNLVVMTAFAKLWFDGKRKDLLTAEIHADLYNHDLHSRQVAKEAIEKYNQHIEQCNRAIEDSGSGHSSTGSATESDELKARLQQTVANLRAMTLERDGLKEELTQKSRVVTDLSLRVQALTDQMNGNGKAFVVGAEDSLSPASNAEYMKLINSLQQQLHAERDKNKHLKGA